MRLSTLKHRNTSHLTRHTALTLRLQVDKFLPGHIDAVKATNHVVVWQCDAMVSGSAILLIPSSCTFYSLTLPVARKVRSSPRFTPAKH